MSYLSPPMAGRLTQLLEALPTRGTVHLRVRLPRKAVAAGDAIAATLILRAEGRGGRVKGLTLRLERHDWDGAHAVATTEGGLNFLVRPGVEVTYPVAVPVDADAVPSGTRSHYALVAEGRVGFRQVRTETRVVVLPVPEEDPDEILRRGVA